MKIVLKGFVSLFLERDIAEKLIKITSNNPEFESVRSQLEEELTPSYEYQIKCQDCSSVYTYTTKSKLTEDCIKQGGICSSCSDDYK